MGMYLTVEELHVFASDIPDEKAEQMISDAEAIATLIAPCLDFELEDFDLSETKQAAVRAVIRGAILRWHDSGSGAFKSQQTGPFGAVMDTRQPRRGMFWPSEIEQLQGICKGADGGAFDIDTVSTCTVHADICALNFGAIYCSCGADIAGFPLWEYEA